MHPNRAHLMHLSGPQGHDLPVLLPKEQAALRVDIQGQPAALRPIPHEADLPPQEQGTVPILPDQFGVAEALLTVHQTFRNPRRQSRRSAQIQRQHRRPPRR